MDTVYVITSLLIFLFRRRRRHRYHHRHNSRDEKLSQGFFKEKLF